MTAVIWRSRSGSPQECREFVKAMPAFKKDSDEEAYYRKAIIHSLEADLDNLGSSPIDPKELIARYGLERVLDC